MNVASIIDGHPDDHVALISRGHTTTYRELRDQVASLRGGFVGLGLEPGDRIGIACANNWYFVTAYLAALGAGLVVAPVNPSSPAPELTGCLESIECKALVAGPAARHSVQQLDRSAVTHLEHLIEPAGGDLGDAVCLDDLLESDPVDLVERGPDDLAVLMFTSGTAGSPKAAMVTHGNLLANLEQMTDHPGRLQGPEDVVLGVLPMFHIFGLNVMLNLSLRCGSTLVLVERFDPSTALDTVRDHGVTVISGAPTMWAAWANLPGADLRAFSTVRLASSGAAKLPVETAQLFEDRFEVTIEEGYGLTEASPVVSTASGTDAPRGSVGSVLPGIEVRLVDADGQDALEGDSGEIWTRGPNIFAGYWEDPDATAGALTGDGWLRTGDVAIVDENGYLYLVDRAKDIIIVSGFNVYPAEVENVLIEHPAIDACAVVGVPHPYSGEAVKAFVVLREGVSAEEDDVIAWCSERLARYKCPDKVMFVDELPQGAGGKVLRRALR